MPPRSKSRYAPNCEPWSPLDLTRIRRQRGEITRKYDLREVRDSYEETYNFCQDMLKRINEKYIQNADMPTSRNILNMKELLAKMEEKAKRIGIDPGKEVSNFDTKAEIKNKILECMKEGQILIQKVENS